MKVLALDTSTMMATCAVLDENRVLGEYSLNQDMTHSEKLVPMIREVLYSLNLKVEDIDLYGAAIGPGSFTGLRIGIATIKGFAHLFEKPVVGVSTLEGLAYNLPCSEIVVPMIDARRDRVYTGIYSWEKKNIKTIMNPTVLDINELLNILDNSYEEIVVNGDGSLLHRDIINETLKEKVIFSTIGQDICRAVSIGELAIKKYREGNIDNYYSLIPDYLRESQAQRELDEKRRK